MIKFSSLKTSRSNSIIYSNCIPSINGYLAATPKIRLTTSGIEFSKAVSCCFLPGPAIKRMATRVKHPSVNYEKSQNSAPSSSSTEEKGESNLGSKSRPVVDHQGSLKNPSSSSSSSSIFNKNNNNSSINSSSNTDKGTTKVDEEKKNLNNSRPITTTTTTTTTEGVERFETIDFLRKAREIEKQNEGLEEELTDEQMRRVIFEEALKQKPPDIFSTTTTSGSTSEAVSQEPHDLPELEYRSDGSKQLRMMIRDEVTADDVHKEIKKFMNDDKIDFESFRLFRTMVTFDRWLAPVANQESILERKIVAKDFKKKRIINIYSERKFWESNKIGEDLLELENITEALHDDITEVIIDQGSDHAFTLPKSFYSHIRDWMNYVHNEEFLYHIRVASDLSKQYVERKMELPDEYKEHLVARPIVHLRQGGSFLFITRKMSSKEVEILMSPTKREKMALLFTAPDHAHEFTRKYELSFDKCVKVLPTLELFKNFKELNVEGVHVNCMNTRKSISREMILSKQMIEILGTPLEGEEQIYNSNIGNNNNNNEEAKHLEENSNNNNNNNNNDSNNSNDQDNDVEDNEDEDNDVDEFKEEEEGTAGGNNNNNR